MKKASTSAKRDGAPAGTPAPGRLRIIGGRFRRTPIPVLAAPGLRPTPDRVRVTLFNWLEHLRGGLSGAAALDLFAGTGSLGFEMASRGAARVVLVDRHGPAVAALRLVKDRLGASGVEVLQADWRTAIEAMAPASFDVVFLDPPFDSGVLVLALAAVRGLLTREGLIYAESPLPLADKDLGPLALDPVRSGRAGSVHFHLLRARPC